MRAVHLRGQGGDDGLRVDEAGVAQVVQAAGGEDLRARLPPHRLLELHPPRMHSRRQPILLFRNINATFQSL